VYESQGSNTGRLWARVGEGSWRGALKSDSWGLPLKPGDNMKHHHILALSTCALALALAPAAARADKPPGEPDAKAGKPPGKPAKPSEIFGKPDGKPGEPAGKPGEHPGKPDADAKGEHGKPGDPGKQDEGKPNAGRGEGFRGAMRELHDELKAGKIKKEDLKDRLAKLHDTAGERGKQHRQELNKRWGGTLAQPSAVEELKHHARRMAFLDRAMVLAETEAKDKAKVTERISKLIDKENERHERAMERLKSMPATPAASAAPSAVPPAAPAASAAGDAKGAVK
jgi:hypothetical protein